MQLDSNLPKRGELLNDFNGLQRSARFCDVLNESCDVLMRPAMSCPVRAREPGGQKTRLDRRQGSEANRLPLCHADDLIGWIKKRSRGRLPTRRPGETSKEAAAQDDNTEIAKLTCLGSGRFRCQEWATFGRSAARRECRGWVESAHFTPGCH